MKTIQPRKQRKKIFNAPQHKKRKWLASHLEENLLLKYDKRSIPVIKGDTVKVLRGSFKGHEDKVVKVNTKKRYIEIEGLIMSKADGNKIAKPINASNVMITKLNLTDKWRRMKIERGLSEETKKEIEKEAEEQLKEKQEEEKRLEAEKKAAEEAEKEETEEETSEEEVKEQKTVEKEEKEKKETEKQTSEKKTKSKTDKKPAKKKTESKPKKKETEKKKTTSKKPEVKKTSTKKEEKNK